MFIVLHVSVYQLVLLWQHFVALLPSHVHCFTSEMSYCGYCSWQARIKLLILAVFSCTSSVAELELCTWVGQARVSGSNLHATANNAVSCRLDRDSPHDTCACRRQVLKCALVTMHVCTCAWQFGGVLWKVGRIFGWAMAPQGPPLTPLLHKLLTAHGVEGGT